MKVDTKEMIYVTGVTAEKKKSHLYARNRWICRWIFHENSCESWCALLVFAPVRLNSWCKEECVAMKARSVNAGLARSRASQGKERLGSR